MLNKVVLVNGTDKRVSIVNGFVRLICTACATGTYDAKASDSCWNNSSNNIGTMEELTQLASQLEHWPGGSDKKLDANLFNHQVSFHMDEDGDRYLIIGCTAIDLHDIKAALAELREIPNVVLA